MKEIKIRVSEIEEDILRSKVGSISHALRITGIRKNVSQNKALKLIIFSDLRPEEANIAAMRRGIHHDK